MKQINKKTDKIRKMSVGAMFVALAYAVTLVIHIKVLFLTFDMKDAVMLVGSMICGPVYALIMPLVVAFLEAFTISETGVYGLIMNFISSVAFSLPACLIYSKKKSIVGAYIGVFTAVLSVSSVMMLANLLITPYYYKMDVAGVAKMIPTLLLPFNLTKASLNAGIVLLIYKPIARALRRTGLLTDSKASNEAKKSNRDTVVTLIIAGAVIAVSLLVFFLVLKADIVFGI